MNKNEDKRNNEQMKGVALRLRAFIDKNYEGKWTVFAREIGAAAGAVKAWLGGTSWPGGQALASMAAVGLDVHWLVTGNKLEPEKQEPENQASSAEPGEVERLRKDYYGALTRIETLTNQLNEATRESINHARRALELEQENEKLKAHPSTHGLGLEEMADVKDIHRALGLRGPVDVSQVLHAAATSFRAVTRETHQSIDDEADAEIKREGGQGGKAVRSRRATSSG